MAEVRMPKKILIVDDSKTVLTLERTLLASRYVIVEAQDGEEALAKAQSEKPDLILLDIVMPKLDGFETCKRLRNAAETKTTPIIIVTTRGEAKNIQAGYEHGCTDYVTKPINAPELLSKIKDCVGE
jgi:DNA-binding response OmpR family regulator